MFSLEQNSYVLLSIVETNENLYSVHHVSECKDSTESGYIFPLTLLFMAAEAIKRRETFVYLQAIFETALAIPPLHSRYPFLPTKALNPDRQRVPNVLSTENL